MTQQEDTQENTQEMQEDGVVEVSFEQLMKKQKVFVDRKPVKKEIVWEQQDEEGKTTKTKFNVFVRRQNFATFSNYLANPNDHKNNSRLIAESLSKDEKGDKNLLTVQQVETLHPMLAILFLNAINDVNTKKKLTPEDDFFHELVLCGIGGRTIKECKENLSFEEFQSWILYRNLRGPLSLHQRVDRSGALVASSMSGAKMRDLMPYSKDIEENEKQATFNSEKGFLLTAESVAQLAEMEERKAKRVAKNSDKVVQSKGGQTSKDLTKEERLARLKRLNK